MLCRGKAGTVPGGRAAGAGGPAGLAVHSCTLGQVGEGAARGCLGARRRPQLHSQPDLGWGQKQHDSYKCTLAEGVISLWEEACKTLQAVQRRADHTCTGNSTGEPGTVSGALGRCASLCARRCSPLPALPALPGASVRVVPSPSQPMALPAGRRAGSQRAFAGGEPASRRRQGRGGTEGVGGLGSSAEHRVREAHPGYPAPPIPLPGVPHSPGGPPALNQPPKNVG